MPVTADKPAPYAPKSSIWEVVTRRRDRGLNVPITADVLARAGTAQSLIPRTLQTLQTLDLIDEDGNPTEIFEGLRVAPSDEFQDRLQNWLKSAYADVFSYVDPSQDDETKIKDAFRSYHPVGQQGRMVTLFRELCAEAGLTPPKDTAAKKAPARPRPANSTAKPIAAKAALRAGNANVVGHVTTGAALPPAISGLIASLPSSGWTATERDKFLATFKVVIDYAIPIIKKSENENGGPS